MQWFAIENIRMTGLWQCGSVVAVRLMYADVQTARLMMYDVTVWDAGCQSVYSTHCRESKAFIHTLTTYMYIATAILHTLFSELAKNGDCTRTSLLRTCSSAVGFRSSISVREPPEVYTVYPVHHSSRIRFYVFLKCHVKKKR